MLDQKCVAFIPLASCIHTCCNPLANASARFVCRELFQNRPNAPACGRNRWLQTEPADDLFENRIVLRGGSELRGYFDAAVFRKVGALEPPQAELAITGTLQQQSTDMRLLGISADHPHVVMKVGFCLRDRLPVDDPNQWPQ